MRSKLFVPGSRPELFEKALLSAADGLSFDLEDSVAAIHKHIARRALGSFLRGLACSHLKTLIVRVNERYSEHFMADLEAVVCPQVNVINLPKAESIEDIQVLAKALETLERQAGITTPLGILANIETSKGLRQAAQIAAAHPRVMGLQLGLADLFEPLGIDREDTLAVHQVLLALRLAAGESGVACFDTAYAAVGNPDAFLAEAQMASRLGFAGKSCIHPTQIPLANQAFLPSMAAVAHSLQVIEAAHEAEKAGVGAFMVNGQMVDEPFIRTARRIVEQARNAGLLNDISNESRAVQ